MDAPPAAEALAAVLAVQVDDTDIDVIIDVDLKQVEEDSIITQKNEVDMKDAACVMIAQQREVRPKRTLKGYRKGLTC